MIYILEKQLWKDGNESAVKTEIGEVVLRLETRSFSLGSKVSVYDRYHVEIGLLKKRMFTRFQYDIYYDDQVIASVYKRSFMFSKKYILKTVEGVSFKIKGNIKDHSYQLVRRGKTYAKISSKYANKEHQFGLKTEDAELKYAFLCTAVILTL